jgi:hypothetical protein
MTMQKSIGNQWAKITKFIPGRSDNAIKNRYHALLRAKTRGTGVGPDDNGGMPVPLQQQLHQVNHMGVYNQQLYTGMPYDLGMAPGSGMDVYSRSLGQGQVMRGLGLPTMVTGQPTAPLGSTQGITTLDVMGAFANSHVGAGYPTSTPHPPGMANVYGNFYESSLPTQNMNNVAWNPQLVPAANSNQFIAQMSQINQMNQLNPNWMYMPTTDNAHMPLMFDPNSLPMGMNMGGIDGSGMQMNYPLPGPNNYSQQTDIASMNVSYSPRPNDHSTTSGAPSPQYLQQHQQHQLQSNIASQPSFNTAFTTSNISHHHGLGGSGQITSPTSGFTTDAHPLPSPEVSPAISPTHGLGQHASPTTIGGMNSTMNCNNLSPLTAAICIDELEWGENESNAHADHQALPNDGSAPHRVGGHSHNSVVSIDYADNSNVYDDDLVIAANAVFVPSAYSSQPGFALQNSMQVQRSSEESENDDDDESCAHRTKRGCATWCGIGQSYNIPDGMGPSKTDYYNGNNSQQSNSRSSNSAFCGVGLGSIFGVAKQAPPQLTNAGHTMPFMPWNFGGANHNQPAAAYGANIAVAVPAIGDNLKHEPVTGSMNVPQSSQRTGFGFW